MRSHLPDPIIIHLEKRSLGLSETQIIPGKGQEKALQNIEPDLTHHLTFQARYWFCLVGKLVGFVYSRWEGTQLLVLLFRLGKMGVWVLFCKLPY